jgi:hypothetical protein
MRSFQFIRCAEQGWDIYVTGDASDKNARISTYEHIGRVLYDYAEDRYYIEKRIWERNGGKFARLPQLYLTKDAAFAVFTRPKKGN